MSHMGKKIDLSYSCLVIGLNFTTDCSAYALDIDMLFRSVQDLLKLWTYSFLLIL